MNFFKKPIVIISVIILLVGGVVFYVRAQKSNAPKIDTITARRGNLIQLVEVTGRVEASEAVDLALERGGRVTAISAKVGDIVKTNSILVTLNARDLRASLASARATQSRLEAVLATRQAELDELKKGTRPEEIVIAETKIERAKQVLADAESKLANANTEAVTALQNYYNDVVDTINDAATKADDAVLKQTDEIFINETTSPKLSFTVTDSQVEINANSSRVLADKELQNLDGIIADLSNGVSNSVYDQALTDAESSLSIIRDFLNDVAGALNVAAGVSQATLNSYKTNVNLGRTNVNTAISNVRNLSQTIAATKAANNSAVTTAAAAVNDAKQALLVSGDELRLLQAGSTVEAVKASEARVKQAEANVAAQVAEVQRVNSDLAKTILRSPIDGVVTKQEAKVGEIVAANINIVSIISMAAFEISANVPEADIAKVTLGAPATVTLDAYGDDVGFMATVTAIDPAETIIEGVATYEVTLRFDEEDERVKSGMTANVEITTATRDNVIAVPQRAVISKNGGKFVRVLKGENVVEVEVQMGLRGSSGTIEISNGLEEGDEVIIFIEEE